MAQRSILAISGADRISFLQGLVTNDLDRLGTAGIIYTALLSPQGKYIADFFVLAEETRLLIDVAASHAPALAQRLNLYKLRADVQITQTALVVSRGTTAPPAGALADPRHPALGWRQYGTTDQSDSTDWTALRVAHVIPETGIELTPETYILEARFEALNGVDFRKGCYVGQEIVARMKHKTELRKGLAGVRLAGAALPGTPITTADGKEAGLLHSVSGDQAIAYLRFDRATGPLWAGATAVSLRA